MQDALVSFVKRKIIPAITGAAILYASIFAVNFFSPSRDGACSTAYFPPKIHCRWTW
jgi:hypothetical protein